MYVSTDSTQRRFRCHLSAKIFEVMVTDMMFSVGRAPPLASTVIAIIFVLSILSCISHAQRILIYISHLSPRA